MLNNVFKWTQTLMLSCFHFKVFIIEINQWKFKQNLAKNKEVTAFRNLAITSELDDKLESLHNVKQCL